MTKSDRLLKLVLSEFAGGRWPSGSQLPTHREFAEKHGVSLTVVNKVYEELRRRDLVTTGRRRGTIVKGGSSANRLPSSHYAEARRASQVVDFTHNFSLVDSIFNELDRATLELLQSSVGLQIPSERTLQDAGRAWFERLELSLSERGLIPALGAQHALLAALLTLRRRFPTIYAEGYTYSGLKLAARALDFPVVPIDADAGGISIEHLKTEIKESGPGVIYLMPSMHNPMAFQMPGERKRDLTRLAKQQNCIIIEDETYRYLSSRLDPSCAAEFPEGTITLTTLSKVYGPQVQLAYLACPVSLQPEIHAGLRACVWGITSPLAQVICAWLLSGRIDEHVATIRSQSRKFRTLIEARFPPKALSSGKEAFFAWLRLPSHWTSGSFVEYARRRGVLVLSQEQFSLKPKPDAQFVRFSGLVLGVTDETLAKAVGELASIFVTSPIELIDSA